MPTREHGSLVCLWPWDDENDEKVTDEDDGDDENDADCHGRLKEVLCQSHIAGDVVRVPGGGPHSRRDGRRSLVVPPGAGGPRPGAGPKIGNGRGRHSSGEGGRRESEGDETITIAARCVVNAAGIDSDLVQSRASFAIRRGSVAFLPPNSKARPRRGQYVVFAMPEEGVPMRPIQPVPPQH